MEQTQVNGSAGSMREMQAGLERLERREWWRWSSALFIMLLLILAVFFFSAHGAMRDSFTQSQLDLAIKGLFAMVVIFEVFAVHQQIKISRSRRRLAGQIGVLAALEALKPTPPEDQEGQNERRRVPRFPVDQRLKVIVTRDDGEETIYGRVIDISEFGLGAVIAGSIDRGHAVRLEFRTGTGDELRLTALARYARGFRHGFEFAGPSVTERENLKHACTGMDIAVLS
jgi:hypothetical protein